MALVLADRVKETTTTSGTGTLTLDGAATGFQTFVAGVGDGNTCMYCISDGTNWEVGIGTVTDAASDTLSRNTILDNSLGTTSAISFGAGTKDVWCTLAGPRTGGLEKLEEKSASASATLDFTNYIDAQYQSYFFVILDIVPATDGAVFYIRTSTDGGSTFDSGASDYQYSYVVMLAGSSVGQGSSTAATQIITSGAIGSLSGEGLAGTVELFNPSNTVQHKHVSFCITQRNSAGILRFIDGTGTRSAAADVDAVRFFMNSGNIASGKIILYGRR